MSDSSNTEKKREWDLPKGPFKDVELNHKGGDDWVCPANGCNHKWEDKAGTATEYRRHVGSAHLSPYLCLICNNCYCRKADCRAHIATMHKEELGGITRAAQEVHFRILTPNELAEKAKKVPFKGSTTSADAKGEPAPPS